MTSRTSILRSRTRAGVALLSVLAMVTLLSILLVGLMAVTRLDRLASSNYAQSLKAEPVVRGAGALILEDLLQEIRAGSDVTTTDGLELFIPRSPQSVGPVRLTPATGPALPANVIRVSQSRSLSEYQGLFPTPDFTPATLPPVRVSASSVGTNSANGRKINQSRWVLPRLYDEAATPLPVPDWVILARSGPRVFTAADLPALADRHGPDFALGRFAYVIYDEGGLLDANVAGHPASLADTPERARKGSVAYADLTRIPGIDAPDKVDSLVRLWRNKATAAGSALFQTFLRDFGLLRGFRETAPGDNLFLSRQDLIRYARAHPEILGARALPFLTTFSRDVNLPSFRPAVPTAVNPDLSTVVIQGKPLRRFSLSRLAKLAKPVGSLTNQEKTDIASQFGLTPDTSSEGNFNKWLYRGGNGNTILTLDQVAAQNRQPDFFELLQASILTGSVGVSVGDSVAKTDGVDRVKAYQLIRIGANLIDQYDADAFPTAIRFNNQDFFGVEDIPYLNEMFNKTYVPPAGINYLPFIAFEWWNPHRAVTTASGRPAAVRVRLTGAVTNRFVPFWGAWTDPAYLNTFDSGTVSQPIASSEFENYREPRVPAGASVLGVEAFALKPVAPGTEAWLAWIFQNVIPVMEWQDPATSKWHPYGTFAGIEGTVSGINPSFYATVLTWQDWSYIFGTGLDGFSFTKIDPRTSRLGVGKTDREWNVSNDPRIMGGAGKSLRPNSTKFYPSAWCSTSNDNSRPDLLVQNVTGNGAENCYADADNVCRPADGYLGTSPMEDSAAGRSARPVVLNRPFQSVGELGYVFRDMPWKSLDLFSTRTADSALLDVFCLEEPEVVSGKVNLNTRQSVVLDALLSGAGQIEGAATPVVNYRQVSDDWMAQTSVTPLRTRADLVTTPWKYPANSTGAFDTTYPAIKTQREAVVRALVDATTTRTWNLMIDVIAQTGRYAPTAQSLDQFTVEGETRYWWHVAVDRMTGEIVDQQWERVLE